jgi:tight adherence protein B
MGIGLDPDTSIAVICAIAVALAFGLAALALQGTSGGRRYKRRLNSVYHRAQGTRPAEAAAVRSLSRDLSETRLDRIARDLLPRRELLAARLARTGRAITIGQYAMTCAGLTLLAAVGLWLGTRLAILACLSIGVLIGMLLPHMIIGRMGKRRIAAFIALFSRTRPR